MPLSEEEQRMLAEIERQFYETDPDLAKTVRSTTVYRDAGRSLRRSVLTLMAGFLFLLWSFTQALLLGFVGVLVMLGSAIMIERSLRRMGKASWAAVSKSMRSGAISTTLAERRRRAKEFLKRDGQDRS